MTSRALTKWYDAVTKDANRELVLMVLPAVFLIGIFVFLPVLGLVISFTDLRLSDGVWGSPWVGLDNFRRLFAAPEFPRALRNTLVISFLKLAIGFFMPLILALLLNEVRLHWFKRGIQSLTYIPYFLSWVILGGIFKMLLQQDGPINHLVVALGGKPVGFLTDDAWFIGVLVVTTIWQTAGYGAVIYLAALAGIPPTLYEAAEMDGANRWRQTLHVTLPCLAPTIVVLFVLNTGNLLRAGFDQIYNLYNPLVYDVSDVLETFVLRSVQSLDFGLASAANVFESVVGATLIVAVNAFARRSSGGEHGVW